MKKHLTPGCYRVPKFVPSKKRERSKWRIVYTIFAHSIRYRVGKNQLLLTISGVSTVVFLAVQSTPINRYEILNRYAFLVIFDDFPKNKDFKTLRFFGRFFCNDLWVSTVFVFCKFDKKSKTIWSLRLYIKWVPPFQAKPSARI